MRGGRLRFETECDISKFQLARKLEPAVERGDRFRLRAPAAENGILGGFGDVLEPLQIGFEGLAFIGKFQKASHRRQKHLRQNIEADQRPQGHFPGQNQAAPDTADRRDAKCVDQTWKGDIDRAQLGIELARLQFACLLTAPAREKPVVRSGHAQIVRMIQHLHAEAD